MKEGGTGERTSTGKSEIQGSKIVFSIFRNRDVDLVIDENYWMFIRYNAETYALPQNSLFKFISLLVVTGAVTYHISSVVGDVLLWIIGLVDAVFQRVYDLSQKTNGIIASDRTTRCLKNIKRILVILLLLLVLLDTLQVIEVMTIPKWLLSA